MSAPLDVMSPGCRPYNDLTKALQTLEMMRVAYLILRRNAPKRDNTDLIIDEVMRIHESIALR
jgi:hypothetical protein